MVALRKHHGQAPHMINCLGPSKRGQRRDKTTTSQYCGDQQLVLLIRHPQQRANARITNIKRHPTPSCGLTGERMGMVPIHFGPCSFLLWQNSFQAGSVSGAGSPDLRLFTFLGGAQPVISTKSRLAQHLWCQICQLMTLCQTTAERHIVVMATLKRRGVERYCPALLPNYWMCVEHLL